MKKIFENVEFRGGLICDGQDLATSMRPFGQGGGERSIDPIGEIDPRATEIDRRLC
jgi:hypothetical protein